MHGANGTYRQQPATRSVLSSHKISSFSDSPTHILCYKSFYNIMIIVEFMLILQKSMTKPIAHIGLNPTHEINYTKIRALDS